MELRTTLNIEPSPDKIAYSDHVMFIGSCFASEIGSQLENGKMQVMINPAGTVYNPVSVINTLDTIISGKNFTRDDLQLYQGKWLSFSHYTDFSDRDPEKALDKINRKTIEAKEFLKKAKYLFVTFGTARVYRLKETGAIVSNCHKLPADHFERELLSVINIVNVWTRQLEKLNSLFPGLKIIFTISPVRHWKDGAHGNQVSKSVLFLAVEELLNLPFSTGYFPAYELMMDDLRDYRFYADDMIHPTQLAVDYIWEAFSECYMDRKTVEIWKEASKILKASRHRLREPGSGTKHFAENMISKIKRLEAHVPGIDFTPEKQYFENLIH